MWIILALISALFYAAATMFAKYSVSKVVRSQKGLVLMHGLAAFVLITLLWLARGRPELLLSGDIVKALISGILIGFAAIFYFKAFNMEDASVVTLLTQVIVPMTFIAGFIFLRDKVNLLQIMAAAVILVGITYASWSRKGFHLRTTKVIPIMACATVTTTAVLIISKSVVNTNDVVAYSFYQTLGYLVFGILLTFIDRSTLNGFKRNIKPFYLRSLLVILVSEILYLLAMLAQFKSFTLTNAGLVVSVGASEVFLSIIIGYILTVLIPHAINENIDKKTISRKVIAGILVVGGIIMLNFAT